MRRPPLRPAGAAFPAMLALAALAGWALTGCRPPVSAAKPRGRDPPPRSRQCGRHRFRGAARQDSRRRSLSWWRSGRARWDARRAMKIERAYAARTRLGPRPGERRGRPGLGQGLGCAWDSIRPRSSAPATRQSARRDRPRSSPCWPCPQARHRRQPDRVSLIAGHRPGSAATRACPGRLAGPARPSGTTGLISGAACPGWPLSPRWPCRSPSPHGSGPRS